MAREKTGENFLKKSCPQKKVQTPDQQSFRRLSEGGVSHAFVTPRYSELFDLWAYLGSR